MILADYPALVGLEKLDFNFYFHLTDYETQDNDGEKESVVSVDTTALLHRLLPNSSPLSELQVC